MKDLEGKTFEEILQPILDAARNSWKGEEGLARERSVKKVIERVTDEYSKILGITEQEVLKTIETKRDYSAVNYYQNANFPVITNNGELFVFQNKDDFYKRFPSRQYVCPVCEGLSTDPQICNTNKTLKGTKQICDWKAYGLFGTMGKGIKVIFKDNFFEVPRPVDIFKPIELIEKPNA